MKKVFWKNLMACLLVLGLLMIVSCAKKTITSQPGATTANDGVEVISEDEDSAQMSQTSAEDERITEQELKDQELKDQLANEKALKNARIAAAKEKFINQNVLFEFDS